MNTLRVIHKLARVILWWASSSGCVAMITGGSGLHRWLVAAHLVWCLALQTSSATFQCKSLWLLFSIDSFRLGDTHGSEDATENEIQLKQLPMAARNCGHHWGELLPRVRERERESPDQTRRAIESRDSPRTALADTRHLISPLYKIIHTRPASVLVATERHTSCTTFNLKASTSTLEWSFADTVCKCVSYSVA